MAKPQVYESPTSLIEWLQEKPGKGGGSPAYLRSCSVPDRIMYAEMCKGVSKWKKGEVESSEYWSKYGYIRVPNEEILTQVQLADTDLQKCLESELERKSFAVLRQENPTLSSSQAPRWVVAIRGTSKSSAHDLRNDVMIGVNLLHKSRTVKLLKAVIETLLANNDPSRLTITGHSLGAAKAMLVARDFALDGKAIGAHFFNPPFATVHSFARMVSQFIPSFIRTPPSLRQRIREVTTRFISEIFDGGYSLNEEKEEYEKLDHSGWCPHLYLHKEDVICNSYITDLKRRLGCQPNQDVLDDYHAFGFFLWKSIFQDARTFHLLPRAVYHISQEDRPTFSWLKPLNWVTFRCHKLSNWVNPGLNVKVTGLRCTKFEIK